jgi:hypothetical protein
VRHIGNDVVSFSVTQKYDVVMAGPPCQPWSRANPDALGFDDDRADIFIHCAGIIQEVMRLNPGAKYMMENVVMSRELREKGDERMQEEYMAGRFDEINVKDYGAAQSRPRRACQNVTRKENLKLREPLDPNVLLRRLGVDHDAGQPVANCVMASGDSTHNPPMVRERATGVRRPANLDESEALMGATVGFTSGMDTLETTYADRARMIGNAFHYELVRTIFSEMMFIPTERMMRKVEMYKVETQKMNGGACTVGGEEAKAPPIGEDERYLSGLTDDEMEVEFRRRWVETGGVWNDDGTADMARLRVELKKANTVAYQVPKRSRYQTPGNLKRATLEATKAKLKEGTMRLVKYEANQWISQLFVKGKGRIDPVTNEEAVRFLTDLRSLNDAISYPGHWNQEMPTLADIKADVPQWAEYFAEEDVSNAFEGMQTEEGQEHLLTVAPPVRLNADSFTDEELRSYGMSDEEIETLKQSEDWLLQWVGVPQGLASAAPFWNVHIADGFNRLMGESWRDYWAQYVDDCLVFSATEEQCRHRQRMLTIALRVLGKEVSSKIDRTIRTSGKIAGMKFTKGGVVLDDDAVAALELAMDEVIAKKKVNEKDARRMCGILQYAASAFEWDVNDLTWWSRTTAPITASYKGSVFNWTDECSQCVKELRKRVTVVPRVPCRPEALMQEGWRLVIKSDGSNVGVGACLLLVRCGADGEVTPEMMLNANRVRLISVDSKILSTAEQKWLTFEVEAYGMYRALRKWAGLLMRIEQLGPGTWPPLLWMDSTTAMSKWIGVSVPQAIDHANAKEKRFLSWAEKISYVRHMKMEMRWIAGSANDFADLLSRLAEQIGKAVREREMMPHFHSIKRMTKVKDDEKDGGKESQGVPKGYEAVHLSLAEEEWQSVAEAYYDDDSTVQSVKVSDLYRCVCDGGEGVSSEIQMKVAPWIGRRFFSIRPEGSKRNIMYVPKQQLREHWEDDETRKLVLYVPSGAMVRVTSAPLVVQTEDAEDYEVIDMRRDLMLLVHDNQQHPTIGKTLQNLREVAYWSTMASRDGKDSVQKHIGMCEHCITRETKRDQNGLGCDSSCRCDVLQLDHCVLTDEEREQAGYAGVLGMVDVATRLTVYTAAEGQTAEETAELIMIHWVPYFGVPKLMITDPHSGFASDIMNKLRHLVGIREHEKSAARAKGKVAIVERSNQDLRLSMDDGFAKGGIRSRRDFRLYLSFAMQKRNQVERDGRLSPVQLMTGMKVRTVQNLALQEEDVEMPRELCEDSEFAQRLKEMVQGFTEFEFVMRDEVARKNALRRDKSNQKTKDGDYLEVGSVWSYQGEKVAIVEPHGEVGRPVTATVRMKDGNTKRVKVSELRALAAAMPVHMIPAVVKEGAFVMYRDKEEGTMTGGTIMKGSEESEVMMVHRREQDRGKGKSWMPSWQDATTAHVCTGKKCPQGYCEHTDKIERGLILMAGELTMTHRMTDATYRRALSLQLIGSAPEKASRPDWSKAPDTAMGL